MAVNITDGVRVYQSYNASLNLYSQRIEYFLNLSQIESIVFGDKAANGADPPGYSGSSSWTDSGTAMDQHLRRSGAYNQVTGGAIDCQLHIANTDYVRRKRIALHTSKSIKIHQNRR